MIRIISKGALDCIFAFTRDDIQLVSYAKIDNFQQDSGNKHHILLPKTLETNETFPRLIRKAAKYKVEMMHGVTLDDV